MHSPWSDALETATLVRYVLASRMWTTDIWNHNNTTSYKLIGSFACCSVNPLAWARTVDFFEGKGGAFVKDALWFETPIFIVSVSGHTSLEGLEIVVAELVKDILSGWVFIFSGKENDSLIDKGWLFLGTTEHVDHIFHWHGDWVVFAVKKLLIIWKYKLI